MGTVSPLVLEAVLVLVSTPVWGGIGGGDADNWLLCSYWWCMGRYTALGAGWCGMFVGANMEWWCAAIWLCGMGTVSPLVLGMVPVLVSAPVWGGAGQVMEMRTTGFYVVIGGVWGGTLHLGLAGAGCLWGQI